MRYTKSRRAISCTRLSIEPLEPRRLLDGGVSEFASVGGSVWKDLDADGIQRADESGLPDMLVALMQFGNEVAYTSSDIDGAYSFGDLTPGEYSLRFFAPSGFAFTSQDCGDDDTLDSDVHPTGGRTFAFTLVAGEENSSYDAGLFPMASIGGLAWDDVDKDGVQGPDEGGVPGVLVHLLDNVLEVAAITTTDSEGRYAFSDLLPGEYSIEVLAPVGTRISPQGQGGDPSLDSDVAPGNGRTAPLTLIPGLAVSRDAGLWGTLEAAVVDGLVWHDADGDGIRDAEEAGLGGVTVRLIKGEDDADATTETAEDGTYRFANLTPGSYSIEFVLPDGYTFSPMHRGGDDELDSDVNRSTKRTAPFALITGQDGPTLDAGLYNGPFSDSVQENLRVTEIMAMAGRRDFIELKNISADTPLDLREVRFSYGIVFTFDDSSVEYLFPGEHVVVVDRLSRFEDAYDASEILVAGQYLGSLDRQGELIHLEALVNKSILEFTYDPGWYAITARDTDEDSFSLTVLEEQTAVCRWNSIANWRPSSLPGGSPGKDDPRLTPDPGAIVINEVQAAPLDQGNGDFGAVEWIELYNTTNEDINIGGWYLDDDRIAIPEFWRYKVPSGTIIPAHDHLVFNERDHFGEYFGLSSLGKILHLTAGDPNSPSGLLGYSDTVSFDGVPPGVSFGRHATSTLPEVTRARVYEAEDVPVSIGNGRTSVSTLQIEGASGRIGDVDVSIDVRNLGNLTVTLISPSGTEVRLFSRIPGDGRNIVVDDEAESSISERRDPYTEAFRPEVSLSDLDREDLNGTWRLQVSSVDRDEGGGGRLERWSLAVSLLSDFAGTDFVALSRPTMGEDNAAPQVGPLVINEIMYHPAHLHDEFIELYNPTDSPVDASGWLVGGVEFRLPAGTTIPPDGYALIVPIEPTAFRAKYDLSEDVLVLGPYPGQLNDGVERLELIRPDDVNGDILIDRIQYDSQQPWPEEADQGGGSLERVLSMAYGNDVANWEVTTVLGGTPGRRNSVARTISAVADLEIETVVNDPNPDFGDQTTFTVALSNRGPDAATNVEVTSAIPDGLTDVTIMPTPGTAYERATGVWRVPSLPATVGSNTAILTITGKVNVSNERVTNTAEVTASDQFDWDSTPRNGILVEDDQDVATARVGIGAVFHGTDNDDTFEFTAGESYTVVINGVVKEFSAAEIDTILFDGGAGKDTVVLRGTSHNETVVLYPTCATFMGQEFEVNLTNTEEVSVFSGGGSDTAYLYDSARDDDFIGKSDYAAICGDGYHHRVWFFSSVRAEAGEGNDTARFYDSTGNDEYVAKPDLNVLSGTGFYVEARSFEGTHAYATAGGDDVATFYDSAGDDNFVATPTHAALFGNGFYNRAKYFETTCAYATNGGTDVARFYDSPANDDFVGTPTYAALYNAEYQMAYARGFHHQAKFFEGAHAYATAAGVDVARLYDSPGDDIFFADPVQGALYVPGKYYNRAKFFEGVHAYATSDGRDTARLHGSAGIDVFCREIDECAMYVPGAYYNRAKFFEESNAFGDGGGNDQAVLHDSALDDLLEAEGSWARLTNLDASCLCWISDFDCIKAIGTTGTNTKHTQLSLDFVLELEGVWQDQER